MKHNFSRELTCFNFAQDVIQLLAFLENEEIMGVGVDKRKITKAYNARFAKAMNDAEWHGLNEAIIFLGPTIVEDCATFGLAHMIYHIVED